LDIKAFTPGVHGYDPNTRFAINQSDIYVTPISPYLRNNAMRATFDFWNITLLIFGTAFPIIVIPLV
jgi:hypothetical protein